MTQLARACVFCVVIAAGVLCPGPAQADAQADEYRVKAAFLYKFGGYVEWPDRSFARADSPIAIGVMGADALADELAQIVSGRNVSGRPVLVRKLACTSFSSAASTEAAWPKSWLQPRDRPCSRSPSRRRGSSSAA